MTNPVSPAAASGPSLTPRPDTTVSARLLLRLSLDFVLRFIENIAAQFDGDLVKAVVFFAVAQANIAYIDRSPAEAAEFARLDQAPPDALRRPIAPYKLALSLGLPRETVRRKVVRLLEQGLLVESADGVMAPSRVLAGEAFRQAIVNNTTSVIALWSRPGLTICPRLTPTWTARPCPSGPWPA